MTYTSNLDRLKQQAATLFHPVSYPAEALLELPWLQTFAPFVGLQVAAAPPRLAQPVLWYGRDGLQLYSPEIVKPFQVQAKQYQRTSLAARALGHPRGKRLLDACAGLGRDTMSLVEHNTVTFVDHSLAVCLLLAEYLDRSGFSADVRWDKAEVILAASKQQWDAIYLDPMFPARNKTALPKVDMQHLRHLQTTDGEGLSAADLLPLALRQGAHKIVLKRRQKDPQLMPPTSQVKGRSVRFDVYVR